MRRFRRARGYRRRTRVRPRRFLRRRSGFRRRRVGASRKTKTWRSRGIYRSKFQKFNRSVVPDITYARCTYKTGGNVGFDSAISLTTNVAEILKCNDPYDPDVRLANQFSQGFDYFRDYYRDYICTKSVITVTFANAGTQPLYVYVLPKIGPTIPSITLSSTQQTIMNLPYVKYRKLMPPGASNQTVSIKSDWSIMKDVGGSNRGTFWENTTYSAATNASPVVQRPYYIFGSTFSDQSVGVGTEGFRWHATVTYFVKFYGRKLTDETEDPQ